MKAHVLVSENSLHQILLKYGQICWSYLKVWSWSILNCRTDALFHFIINVFSSQEAVRMRKAVQLRC